MKSNQEQNNRNEMKEVYEKPMIEVIEMETEGILCASGDDYRGGGGSPWQ